MGARSLTHSLIDQWPLVTQIVVESWLRCDVRVYVCVQATVWCKKPNGYHAVALVGPSTDGRSLSEKGGGRD